MEVASDSTADNDLGYKRDLYAWLGITEYWRFDASGDELYPTELLGERLVDGEYVPYELNEEPDGSVWSHSEVLGLDFWWTGFSFDIRDPLTGLSIDTVEVAERERIRAEQERERAERAERAVERERLNTERERQARLDLEERFRKLLEEREGDDGQSSS